MKSPIFYCARVQSGPNFCLHRNKKLCIVHKKRPALHSLIKRNAAQISRDIVQKIQGRANKIYENI